MGYHPIHINLHLKPTAHTMKLTYPINTQLPDNPPSPPYSNRAINTFSYTVENPPDTPPQTLTNETLNPNSCLSMFMSKMALKRPNEDTEDEPLNKKAKTAKEERNLCEPEKEFK